MQARGYRLIDCGNIAYIKGRNSVGIGGEKGQMVAADALYFKSLEVIKKILPEGDTQKLARILMTCLSYGYPDYALEICCELKKSSHIREKFLNECIAILQEIRPISNSIPKFPGRASLSRLLWHASNLLNQIDHVCWLNPLGSSTKYLKK